MRKRERSERTKILMESDLHEIIDTLKKAQISDAFIGMLYTKAVLAVPRRNLLSFMQVESEDAIRSIKRAFQTKTRHELATDKNKLIHSQKRIDEILENFPDNFPYTPIVSDTVEYYLWKYLPDYEYIGRLVAEGAGMYDQERLYAEKYFIEYNRILGRLKNNGKA